MVLIRYVGLDVHKDSIKIAVAEEGRDPASYYASVPGETNKLIKQIRKLGPKNSLRCCYEAGPGGYTVYRSLTAAGIDCKVIEPLLIPKQHGKRVKSHRLDAENPAHYSRSGDLIEVWVPDEATESIRNLVRFREDARIARIRKAAAESVSTSQRPGLSSSENEVEHQSYVLDQLTGVW